MAFPPEQMERQKQEQIGFNFAASADRKVYVNLADMYTDENKEENSKISAASKTNDYLYHILKDMRTNDGKNKIVVDMLFKMQDLVQTHVKPSQNDDENTPKPRLYESEYQVFVRVLNECLKEFSKVINVYLKVEWNKAKQGR